MPGSFFFRRPSWLSAIPTAWTPSPCCPLLPLPLRRPRQQHPGTTKLPATASESGSGDKIAQAKQANLLTVSGAKAQFNLSIVQSSLEVSLQTQNDPLSLVYKTAIENINDILRPQLGDNAIQTASTQDNSPEATAGRIVSFITNMFDLYKKNNPDKDDAGNIDDYMNLIFKGVDQGSGSTRHPGKSQRAAGRYCQQHRQDL
jgi:hypothetical protein